MLSVNEKDLNSLRVCDHLANETKIKNLPQEIAVGVNSTQPKVARDDSPLAARFCRAAIYLSESGVDCDIGGGFSRCTLRKQSRFIAVSDFQLDNVQPIIKPIILK